MTETAALELFLLILSGTALGLMAATWVGLRVLDRRLEQRRRRRQSPSPLPGK